MAGADEVPPGVVLTPAAVAGRLGVAVATLRSWDRRHGLGPTGHESGRHRRYTAADVRRLERVLNLVRQGVPVASAAAAVLAEPSDEPAGWSDGEEIEARLRGLREAAERLDPDAVRRIATAFVREFGTVEAWRLLLVPFLVELGERCAGPDGPVEIEHVVTNGILAALHARPPMAVAGPSSVLLACAPDEQHTLPLEVLSQALAERGRGSLLLGARVPAGALLAAARTVSPAQIVVWAHTQWLAWRVPVDELVRLGAGVVLAGPGWADVRVPPQVRRPRCLHEAISAVCEPDQDGACGWNCHLAS